MRKKTQYSLYILFAFISTLLNIGIQKITEMTVKWLHPAFYGTAVLSGSNITLGLLIQMCTATVLAFIFKYLADKLLIFRDKTAYISGAHFKQIVLYGSFAVLTTVIFWGTELIFKNFLPFKDSEYIGAFLGLLIGYSLKFFLDRKYVFSQK
jgi:hypothetical protein